MKISTLFLFILPAAALALPVEQAQDAGVQLYRRFTCPPNVQDFCSASNIHSGCSSDGKFTSNAMDTCGGCKC
ncbi:uncharacterized protein TRIVIDRAFT_223574 [Trichoderma virens Gv29-8]|uniref:Uncharacterized protein n=1 Tax=Hypocrea virens (strain Gv29-8 / FGSC 10586) TaxID=413071 RepID=G9MXI3_HYPVG|nr:uncharacterized protein TRIVIDRAFT_223574 [Trichoderma virens Gv29-8]EHK20881.1 hypothetical protein TRIVIDRAFT_223574 [Trichoderma virens Gv29-8]UKZ56851.1 hypothetical protein TrVGV298_010695 [Trichoderma virens]UKZ82586.1 hypothetical protein TrVFT333_010378 [Trichoderma virens FT-333]